MFSIVVAFDRNRVIGSKDRIPWKLRKDLLRLKDLTKGRVVILGRKTFDSMVWYYDKANKKLPGKIYIVVTRDESYSSDRHNIEVAGSIEESFEKAKSLDHKGEIFIIGGAKVYEQTLPLVDKLYITEVDTEADGDAYFPVLSDSEWEETDRKSFFADEKNEFDYSFVTLKRR